MDTSGQVALWVGLISSVVSIVLSVVAIAFAILVDRSARAVTAQTIKSLQKIESDVERLSGDTRELIKAGWDKMLGSVSGQSVEIPDAGAKDIAAGVAAELRAELASMASTKIQTDRVSAEQSFEDLVKRLEQSLAAQIRSESVPDRSSLQLEQARLLVEGLSSGALALALGIQRTHLTRRQYMMLSSGPLEQAVHELRASGLLVPVRGFDGKKEIPVYYFPPKLAKAVRAALPLAPGPPQELIDLAGAELARVGYSIRTTV